MTPRRTSGDFAAELASHIEIETDRLIATGLAPAVARAQARRTFGNLGQTQETRYESRRAMWLENLWRDVRLSLRGLRTRPGFTLTAVVSLGLGIGLNTSVFSIIYALAFRPFPVPDSDRVVNVYQNVINGGGRMTMGPWTWISYPDYQLYREASSFDGLAVYRTDSRVMSGDPSVPVEVSLVSCNYFATLRIGMAMGRSLGSADCARPGGEPVAVLEHRFWTDHFGADPAIVGKAVQVRGSVFTVVGVAQAGFSGVDWQPADLWVPITIQPAAFSDLGGPDALTRERASWLNLIGRLGPTATRASAAAELTAIGQRGTTPSDTARRVQIIVARGSLLNEPGNRRQGSPIFGSLLAASGLVIVLACTNLVNLLLARGLTRRREIAIRLALGAHRGRVVRQLMTESLLLGVAGSLVGLLLVYWIPPLLAAVAPGDMLARTSFGPSPAVFGYAMAVAVLSAAVFGLVPALDATRLDLAASVRAADALSGRLESQRLRRGVVVVQVAGSALLVTLAFLFVRSLGSATTADLGYQVDQVTTVSLGTDELGYDSTRTRAVYDQLRERLGNTPGVTGTALTRRLPFSGRSTSDVETVDRRKTAWALFHQISPEYFAMLGIRLLRGRVFRNDELGSAGEQPVVVSQTMATALWAGDDPIGQRIRLGTVDDTSATYFVVVGVAADIRSVSLGESDQATIYQGIDPTRPGGNFLLIAGAPAAVSRGREFARDIDPSLPIQVGRLADRIDAAVGPARLAARFSGGLGALATALALIGIYGIVSYGVTRRSREFGVRIALGATSRQVLGVAIEQGVVSVTVGLVAGIVLAFGAAQVLRGAFYGVPAFDLVSLTGVVVAIAVTTGVAMLVPARRATRIDPTQALRIDS